MDQVIATVKEYRDQLVFNCDAEAAASALAALHSLGSIPEEVLATTHVGLVVSHLGREKNMPEAVRTSCDALVKSWQGALRRWRREERDSRERSRSPETDVAAVPHLTKQREQVVYKLLGALEAAAKDSLPSPSVVLAAEIEAALHEQLEGRKYLSQARSLLYNLKDESNESLRRSLLTGGLAPARLPWLTAEDMASSDKNAQRAQQRQEAFQAAAVRPAQHCVTDRFTCEKCSGRQTAYTQSAAVESCVRSGGEPVETTVTFVTCLACSHAWTERSGFA
ncbi:unnamed protein product [Effrenium voratum]|nr:unnamed protein product [Effrenium voratum]